MFGIGKKKLNSRHNIRELEKEAANSLPKKYKISTQQTSKRTGKRPDVFAINPKDNRDRIIVDAKCVSEVRPENIKQVKEYKKISKRTYSLWNCFYIFNCLCKFVDSSINPNSQYIFYFNLSFTSCICCRYDFIRNFKI